MEKIILITGGLSGIGRASALAFAKQGDVVAVAGRNEEAGRALEQELKAVGGEGLFVKADVRFEDEVAAMVDTVQAAFGRIDAAVNAAGTEGVPGPLSDQTAETFDLMFDTNVLGTMLSMKHEIRIMVPQGHGNIVNVSSILGQRGAPNSSLYSASKHAVDGLTKSAALELAETGIRVNSVAPGGTQTRMFDSFTVNEQIKATVVATIPLKRAGHVDEIAGAITFMASDQSTYMTGQILGIDGGRLAR